jgi:hypothetical protein
MHQSNIANNAATIPTNAAPVGLFGKGGFAPTNLSDASSNSGQAPFGFQAAPSVAAATSAFGATFSALTNAPTASSFGGFARNTNFAGFGAVPSAATTPAATAGFGFPAQVQSVTGSGFGQPQANVSESSAAATAAAGGGTRSVLYTPVDQLTVEEKSQFEAGRFTLGHVPVKPPPQVYI